MAQRLLVNYRKLSLLVVALALSYGEFLCHLSAYWSWSRGEQPPGEDGWRRMLVVADPQLVGLRDEPAWPLGALTRWDADRYLAATFRWALSHAAPVEVVAFLGDLIDEGSSTSFGPDYQSYVSRFRSIYPSDSAKHFVFVSGDNDVGGEGGDAVTGAKVDRFRAFFPERRLTSLPGGLRLVVHNVMTAPLDQDDPQWDLGRSNETRAEDDGGDGGGGVTLLLSHVPLLTPFMSAETKRTIRRSRPDLLFSAHVHRASASVANRSLDVRTVNGTEGVDALRIDLDSDRRSGLLREIVVPTASYRMGVERMAIGLASIRPGEAERVVLYRNLWLAGRFPVLYVYAVAAMLSTLLFCCGRRKKRKRKHSQDKQRSRRSSLAGGKVV